MLLLSLLEIWHTVANCTVLTGVQDLAPTIHGNAMLNSINFDLDLLTINITSHKRLFHKRFLNIFNEANATTEEKMIFVDEMLFCAILITKEEQVILYNI